MEQNDYVSTVLSNKSEIAAKFIQTAENQLVMQRLNQNAEVAI
jgi:hypothetical protein